ncbi:hypothetical protein KA093_00180 [Candidatus Saccharibacteria bacterium]|nr:hypothetical protein [Candidatus Saccharibacteria bacterium]
MKAKKKGITHKQLAASRSQFVLLVLMLAFTILLLIGYLLKDYNPALQQEAEGFTKLKQDFLDLQKEFNKIDQGWVYGDGCTGSGGVFDRDKATDCAMSITATTSAGPQRLTLYRDTAISKGYFDKNGAKQIDTEAYSMNSRNFPQSNCVIEIITEKDAKKITLGCSAPAHYFHFPRTDR